MKASHFSKISTLILSVSLTLFLVSCGEQFKDKQIVTDVLLESYDQDGSLYLDFSLELDLGNTQLPSLSIPISNPYNNTIDYGEVGMLGGFNGINEIFVSANLSNILQLMPTNATLPDGSPVPVGGISHSSIIQIPIFNQQHRLYFAFGRGVAMAGIAITIKQLDAIGHAIHGADALIPFDFGGVSGAAGFFTGSSPGQSGIAIFIDIGGVITPSELLEEKMLTSGAQLKSRSISTSSDYDETSIFFYKKGMSRSKRRKFDKQMYKLHKRRAKLRLN